MPLDKNGGLRSLPNSNSGGVGANNSPSVNAATAAAAAVKPFIRSTRLSDLPSPGSVRRVWFRRRGGPSATSLQVGGDELVDDLKSRILQKFPTSLLHECDPADLAICVPSQYVPSSSPAPPAGVSSQNRSRSSSMSQGNMARRSPLESPGSGPGGSGPGPYQLQPDENVVSVVDRFFPGGMTMSQALEIAPVDTALPTTIPVLNSVPSVPQLSIPRPSRTLKKSNSSNVTPTFRTLSPKPASSTVPGNAVPYQQNQPTVVEKPDISSSKGPTLARKPSTIGRKDGRETKEAKEAGSKNSVLLLPRQLKVSNGKSSPTLEREEQAERQGMSPYYPSSPVSLQNDAGSNLPATVNDDLVELRQMSARNLSANEGSVVVPQINVLIVEDNVINQKILEAFMRKKKVRFEVARNGQEAVSKWRKGGFHLILMDIQLPFMTGLEATKEVRRLEVANRIGAFPSHSTVVVPAPSVPPIEDALEKDKFKSPVIIVALTASADSEDKNEALAAGCNDFLTKPVNLMWLEQKIIEWGCMQALIDFDGWRQWIRRDLDDQKEQPASNEAKARPSKVVGQRESRPLFPRTLSRSRSNFRLQASVR